MARDPGFDCLIVGAGPAGLTAALYLARFRRSLALFDGGSSRASYIPRTRNYPGFPEGISGDELLALLRRQAGHYGAKPTRAEVQRLTLRDGVFIAETAGETLSARRVLLATGIVDHKPEMPNLREAIDAGCIRLCPICDGHEVIDDCIAVYGRAAETVGHAVFMRGFTEDVTLLVPPGDAPVRDEDREKLRDWNIRLLESPVAEIATTADRRARARLADGSDHLFATIYPVLGCSPRIELGRQLGARCNDQGELEVDRHQQTSVPGLYAAGDVVVALNQLSVAVGHAAIAATAMHNSLGPHAAED